MPRLEHEHQSRPLRYREQLGLIATARHPNGCREYSDETADNVRTIRKLLDLGSPTSLISEVLSRDTTGRSFGACATVA
ncbi:MerR family transcriptional regulator [Promicromonospora soli]